MAPVSRSRLSWLTLCASTLLAPAAALSAGAQSPLAEMHIPPALAAMSTSLPEDASPANLHSADTAATSASRRSSPHDFWHSLGFSVHAGVNGVGGDVAVPLAQRFNARVGYETFHYSASFTQEGADVNAKLQLGNGHIALDWFPFRNGFRISPQAMIGIRTRVDATVLVPSGSVINLDGKDYVSSSTDPLRGSAVVGTRHAAPGFSIGWGNIAPRGQRHFSFPVDLGFYYIGQPRLNVNFQGTACDPTVPGPAGCQNVTQDADFQKSLNAFIRRNQNNLSYASFFPVASFGVGYRF
ncbi:MAG: hypothetical protein ACRYGF_15255 [Janthinobacterium lividum]